MKRTPWLITAANALLLLVGATVSYLKVLPEGPAWSPAFAAVASWARAQSAGALLVATVGVIALGVLKESITVYQFRKDRAQRVLGKIVVLPD